MSHKKTQGWQHPEKITAVCYDLPQPVPLVTIVVPSKDHSHLLAQCIGSVEKHTTYSSYEWVVVDNGSNSEEKEQYEKLCSSTKKPCQYVYEPAPFNFSAMCNAGARAGRGSIYLFLNDDMELPKGSEDWLQRMVGQAIQPHVGAVGARLLYPDSTMVQHVGVVNYTSGAAHILWQEGDGEGFPEYRNRAVYNYLIVTGACLMITKEKFCKVNGFCEKLAVTFNDVDLCLKLWEAGWYQVVRNDVMLYHHESLSRGQDVLDKEKFLRGLKEREMLFDMHPKWIGTDPFYSVHRTQKRLDNGLDVADYVPLSELRDTGIIGTYAREGQVRCRILRIRNKEGLFIEGWAYSTHKTRAGKVTLVFVDAKGKQYLCSAHQVYDPTITTEANTGQKLNFASFCCRIKSGLLAEGPCQVGICVSGLYVAEVTTIRIPYLEE